MDKQEIIDIINNEMVKHEVNLTMGRYSRVAESIADQLTEQGDLTIREVLEWTKKIENFHDEVLIDCGKIWTAIKDPQTTPISLTELTNKIRDNENEK